MVAVEERNVSMRRVWMSVLVGVVGCGSEASPTTDPSPTAEQTASETPIPEAPTPEATGREGTAVEVATEAGHAPDEAPQTAQPSALDPRLVERAGAIPFRWYDTAPETGVPSAFGAIGAARRFEVSTEAGRRSFEVTDAGRVVARDGEAELWNVELASPPTAMPTIAGYVDPTTHEELIVVASPVADAWRVEARSASDGAQRWQTSGGQRCLGVQIGVEGDLIALHVREAVQDETFVVRASDGLAVGIVPVHPQASRLRPGVLDAAAIPASRDVPAPTRVSCTETGTIECVLQREGIPGELRWTSAVPSSCRELAVTGEGTDVVVAEICSNATGVYVHGGTLGDPTTHFHTRPFGIGPIAHSRWSNAVRLTVNERWIHVWGTESSLTYVSTVDRATGRELATTTAR